MYYCSLGNIDLLRVFPSDCMGKRTYYVITRAASSSTYLSDAGSIVRIEISDEQIEGSLITVIN